MGRLFYCIIHYNLDKYKFISVIMSFVMIYLILKLIGIIIHKYIFPLNVYIKYWWAFVILFTVVLLFSNFIFDRTYKILKKYDIGILSNNVNKGIFLGKKWAFYPLKWYILWILVFIDICIIFVLQSNDIITIPNYINYILTFGAIFSIFEIIPIKIGFYEEGIVVGNKFYSYENVKILEKGNKKIVMINNIPKYILFDKNKDINHIFGLNNIKNVLLR